MRSEQKESSGFPLRILVRDQMRVLCDVSDVHPLAERAEGKSIATMSAMEFSRMLDTASPQELRALAGSGLRKKANEKRRSVPIAPKKQKTFEIDDDSPGASGWGAPMHSSLVFLHPFLKASSYPPVQKIIAWARCIRPLRISLAIAVPICFKVIITMVCVLANCYQEYGWLSHQSSRLVRQLDSAVEHVDVRR